MKNALYVQRHGQGHLSGWSNVKQWKNQARSLSHCQSTESIKDLGITVDYSLKFHGHTAIVTAKANRILAVINKSFEYLNTNMLPQPYKSFVRPILEYWNIVWGPQFILDQQSVEKIQRRATKLVSEIKESQYVDRLKHVNLPSFRYRWHRGDLIYANKLFS